MEKQVSEANYKNCCESAGILSRENGNVWTCTPNFVLQQYPLEIQANNSEKTYKILVNEAREILNLINNKGASGRPGLRINKQKYEVVGYNEDNETVYLRKPKGGGCISGTNLCIIIGLYNENLQVVSNGQFSFFQNHGICNERVEALSQFLKSNGF